MATEGGIRRPLVVCGIIAFFNEKDSLGPLVRELYKTFEGRPERLRLVLVDDGSVDGSYEVATALQAEFLGIAVLRFSRNFGHHTALIAGIKHAEGDLFFLMDSDFQDDPSFIPKLIDSLATNTEIVYAIRNVRVESWQRRMAASLYWWLVNAATDYHCEPHQAVMRVFTARTRNALLLVDDYFPFLAGIFAWTGYSYVKVDIPHRPRRYGSSKYTLAKLLSSTLTSLLSFSHRPLRLLVYIGFAISALSLLSGFGLIVSYIADFPFFPGWTSVFVGILFSLGIQLGALGLVGEYVGRIFRQTSGRPKYVVREFRQRADGD
jgi:glycosyltransferase involved in cell wall biosynthesis